MDIERGMKSNDKKPLKLPDAGEMPVLPEAELAEITESFTDFVKGNLRRRGALNQRLANFDKGDDRQ